MARMLLVSILLAIGTMLGCGKAVRPTVVLSIEAHLDTSHVSDPLTVPTTVKVEYRLEQIDAAPARK